MSALERLGPEPLGKEFTTDSFAAGLSKSRQPVKVKLLDQSLVAGIGNIYASEALFRAGISPKLSARRLKFSQGARLWQSIREVLMEAIEGGSTTPLDYSGTEMRDRVFYFGSSGPANFYEERLRVYDRQGKSCVVCGNPIRRIVQAARRHFTVPIAKKTQEQWAIWQNQFDASQPDL